MSELKAGVIHTPHDEGMTFVTDSDTIRVNERETKFYLKSEADKVIAEKDKEITELKARIAELEKENAELKEAQRWRKFSEEKPPKYTWCLVSGKSQMGNYIVITDFFEEDDWAENPNLDDDTLDIEWWMPLPSDPKEEK